MRAADGILPFSLGQQRNLLQASGGLSYYGADPTQQGVTFQLWLGAVHGDHCALWQLLARVTVGAAC